MSSSEIDVSPIVAIAKTTITNELSKLMVRFYEAVHEEYDNVPVEKMKEIWEKISGVVPLEEKKKTKPKKTSGGVTNEQTCIAPIATGQRKGQACGKTVSSKSVSGKYCVMHLRQESNEGKKKSGAKKVEIKSEEVKNEIKSVEAEVKDDIKSAEAEVKDVINSVEVEVKDEIKSEEIEVKSDEPEVKGDDEIGRAISVALNLISPPKVTTPVKIAKPEQNVTPSAAEPVAATAVRTKKRKDGLMVLTGSGLLFDPAKGVVVGKDDGKDGIGKLTTEDEEICKKKRLKIAK